MSATSDSEMVKYARLAVRGVERLRSRVTELEARCSLASQVIATQAAALVWCVAGCGDDCKIYSVKEGRIAPCDGLQLRRRAEDLRAQWTAGAP